MMCKTLIRLYTLPDRFRTGTQTRMMVTVLSIVFISSMLVACGASTTAVKSTPSPIPTHLIAPTPTPTFAPTPKPKPSPTQVPTPQPTAAQVPTLPPAPVQAAPAVLDLRPLSMSIVGHLDCNKNGAFVCFARVLSSSSNQSDLHWSAFTNVPGNIVFSPVSGILAPGQSVLVTITVPFTACTPGLFFFRGPINTHTITWAC
jgi:hypothetical protein